MTHLSSEPTTPPSRLASWLADVLVDSGDGRSGLRCSRPRYCRASALAVSLLIFCVISAGLLVLGDWLNAPGMAITRFLARMHAPAVALSYPDHQRDKVALVLYDQEFLDSNKLAWPISYAQHADWLLRLAGGDSPPKAMLIDLTFGQQRKDAGVKELRDALCTIAHEYKIPLFLAALTDAAGALRVRPGLEPDSGDGRGPCFTLVSVRIDRDPVDHIAWNYPLAGGKAGRSAALAIAEDVADLKLPSDELKNETLALVWGYGLSKKSDPPDFFFVCESGEPGLYFWLPALLRPLFAPRVVCPYHRTLSMSQLSGLDSRRLADNVGGKFVVVGAAIPGYNDFIDSPVHGLVPGPYVHAMALDNLLTFKNKYKRSRDWSSVLLERNGASFQLLIAGLLALAVVFGARQFFVWLSVGRRLSACLRLDRRSRHARPLRAQLFRLLGWIARLVVVTFLSIVAVIALQSCLRVGMLPVVELVTMALAAEAFAALDKSRSFLANNIVGIEREVRHYIRGFKAALSPTRIP